MTKNTEKQKATVTQVKIGSLTVEGLRADDGTLGVAVPQIAATLSISTNQASRDIKRALAKGSSLDQSEVNLLQWKTELNPKAVNVLTLDQLTPIAYHFGYQAQKTTEVARQVYHHLTNTTYTPKKKSKTEAKKKKGHIYLMETNKGDIKVGYSVHPQKRLAALQRYPGEMHILATKKGTMDEEQELHAKLHNTGLSLGVEWYPAERKDEILGYFN